MVPTAIHCFNPDFFSDLQNWNLHVAKCICAAGVHVLIRRSSSSLRLFIRREAWVLTSRFKNETKRLYGVLEKHLTDSKSEYIVGDKCTIADISCWGWVSLCKWCNIDLSEFPALKAWDERMLERPAVEKGRQVPEKHQREMLQDPKAMEEMEAKARDFYKRMAEEGKMTKEGV